MLIELWQTKKRIAFLHGAITLSICLFMKGLLTFSMDGLTILKTWACCSEREDSWFLLDLAPLTFCFLKHLRYCRFWKTGKNPPVDVFYFCFVMSQNVTTRLYPSVYSRVFHWVHLRLQAPLINRGMVPICCFPFACCFFFFELFWHLQHLVVGHECRIDLLRCWDEWRGLGWNRCPVWQCLQRSWVWS